jgi:uncharacterized protein
MHLTLHLTNRCNLACRYCYQRHGEGDMSAETARTAIRNCASGENCGIIFFGGEPLLRRDLIFDTIRWCEGLSPGRFHYKVTTNGTLLDEDFLREARAARLAVALSLDGVGSAHDSMRVFPDGTGTYGRILPKLHALTAWQPYAPVMMTVNPETVASFAAGVRALKDAGVRYLIASLNFAGNWTNASFRKLKGEYRELGRMYLEDHRAERKFYFSPFDTRIASHIAGEVCTTCRLGKRQISVAPDGTLYPCVQFVDHAEYAIGSAETGIDESRREAIFLRNEAVKPTCEGCDYVRRCHNRCGCLNFQTTGGLDAVTPLLCEHERFLIRLSDKLANTLYAERNPLFLQQHYNPSFSILSILEDMR